MKLNIFYIDDEAGCLNLFTAMFGGEYDVRTATTLADARRMLADHPPDIVISDQTMPEIQGTDFLKEVAQTYPSTYRVLLTGSIGFGQVMPEIGAGIIHFFAPKPWTEQNVRQMFDRAIVYFEVPGKVQ